MSERRQHLRRRTLLKGRLEIDKLNGWALACSVRNVSEGGARVTIPGGVVVPQNVGLAVSGQPRRPARLVWYREGQAGFAMVEGQSEARAVEPVSTEATAAPGTPAPAEIAGNGRLAARLAAITAGRRPSHFTRP